MSVLNLLDNIDELAPKHVNIEEFAESNDYCGIALYPRQLVLQKLIFLEEMTGAEEDVLTYWINGGRNGSEITISPNIRERRDFLRENGYAHFREIQLAVGRRASKGLTTGLAMAYKLFRTLQLGNPGDYYGIDVKKEIYFSCIAGSEAQAKKFQYADMVSRIESNPAFEPYIAESLETEIRIMTPADIRQISAARARGSVIKRDQARLRGNALAANASTLRGSTTMMITIDEAAHMIAGESKSSAQEVYNAAGPSLDQFGIDGMMFINSSPYSKVGMFYDLYELGLMPFDPTRPVDLTTTELLGDDGALSDHRINGDPRRLVFQGPSWSLFEGYRYYKSKYKPRERGRMLGKMITVSPDWNPDEIDEEGRELFSSEDKAAIIQARASEAADPETYKVERRGKFAEVSEAWLNPTMVDRMYAGRPIGLVPQVTAPGAPVDYVMGYEPLYTNYGSHTAVNAHRYKFHLDPSSTTAGFGFAIGHIEYLPDTTTGQEMAHCVLDVVKRWNPAKMPGNVIRWAPIIDEIVTLAKIFHPFEITMDQHQSAAPLQEIQDRLRQANIACQVFMRPSTAELNWKKAEVFKTALYQGLVHAPQDEEDDEFTSREELKFLRQVQTGSKYPRIDKQDLGPVQFKDRCFHPSHELLTLEGWKPIADVTLEDQLATRSPDGKMTYHRPLKVHNFEADEDLSVCETRNVDFAVTGDHHLLVKDAQTGIEELRSVDSLFSKNFIPQWTILDSRQDIQRLVTHLGQNHKIEKIESNHYLMTINDANFQSVLMHKDIAKQHYQGPVYCVTMPYGTVLTRRNGVVNWIGNCDAIIDVTWALLGNLQVQTMRERLAQSAISGGSPGGYGIGLGTLGVGAGGYKHPQISEFYSRRDERAVNMGLTHSGIARGALGARKYGLSGTRASSRGRRR